MIVAEVLDMLWGVLGLVARPSVSIYWGYLGGAAIAGTVAIAVRARGRWSIWRILAALGALRVWGAPSVRRDAALLVVNTLAYSLLWAVPLQGMSNAVATGVWAGLHSGVGAIQSPLGGVGLHVLATGLIFGAADLGFFVAHLALHKVPLLWAFHRVHHSADVLVPLTVFRRHPIDILFEGAVSGIFVGSAYGALAYLAGYVPSGYLIAGVNAAFFCVVLVGFNLQHSHIWLSFGPLDRVFISPAAHQIHHSAAKKHVDKNFGNLLSVWDRLCGTYFAVQTRRRPALRFGLEDGAPGHHSVLGLYLRPFVDAAAVVGRSAGDLFRNAGRAGGTPPT